jgi:diguanylate cyclase (GGDEF)-like protein/putative nucleotidyltransferase with HDIG domain
MTDHRGFQDRLSHECERAYRFGDTFALLLVDLDDFQMVNNRYGHKTGDRLLMELASRLRSMVREIDLCARFGGDQFALILPHTLERGAAQTGERLRQSIAAWSFLNPQGAEVRLTASVGLALYPLDAGTPPELVEAAKRCVVFAKSLGGNQLQVFSELPLEGRPESALSDQDRSTIVRSLAAAVDIRDRYTHSHSHLVSELSAATARALGLEGPEVGRVRIGGLLHDVGKIGIPDAILTKQGPLTAEEWSIIREHPVLGKRIVEQSPELADVVPMVLHHQERWDGSGYPSGLGGEAIPLEARIIAAADAYHAIRSDRPYRLGRTHREAVGELLRCAASQFDPRVLSALLECLERDPGLQSMPVPEAGAEVAGARNATRRPFKVVTSKS